MNQVDDPIRESLSSSMEAVVVEFIDDDAGYIAWVAANPDGYVLNIQRSRNPSDARFQAADCGDLERAIHDVEDKGRRVTSTYIKVCGQSLAELEESPGGNVRGSIRRCPNCL